MTVTFSGHNCEIVNFPDGLCENEAPLVLVFQDEAAFHGNDDCPWEWCEEWRMKLRPKSRGALLMVSEFLSELGGRLVCSKVEAERYAMANPGSRIAQKVAAGEAKDGVAARLILEPGANKDKYFDNEQLMEQTRLAMEVFNAMDRHVAPARTVRLVSDKPVCASLSGVGCTQNIKLRLGVCGSGVKKLPPVRCKGLFFFDHSSGHEAGASDGRSTTGINKGPDWNAKVPHMRDGYYANPRGPSHPNIVQHMQFKEGDRLLCDITVPAGIDLEANSGPAATSPPQAASSL